MITWLRDRLSELVELLRLLIHKLNQKGEPMNTTTTTPQLDDEADLYDEAPELWEDDGDDWEDDDHRLDDPRHGQAAGINRENRRG